MQNVSLFYKINKKLNQSGYSLVELSVALSIVAVMGQCGMRDSVSSHNSSSTRASGSMPTLQ